MEPHGNRHEKSHFCKQREEDPDFLHSCYPMHSPPPMLLLCHTHKMQMYWHTSTTVKTHRKKKSSRNPSPLVSPSHSHSHLFSIARIIFFMYSVATPEVRLSGIHLIWPPAVSWWKDKLPTLVSHLNLPRQLLAGRFYNLTNSFITILFECPFALTSSKGKNADLGSLGPGVIFRKKRFLVHTLLLIWTEKKKDKNGDRNVFACFDHTHTHMHAHTHINKIASTRKHHFKESIRSRLLP